MGREQSPRQEGGDGATTEGFRRSGVVFAALCVAAAAATAAVFAWRRRSIGQESCAATESILDGKEEPRATSERRQSARREDEAETETGACRFNARSLHWRSRQQGPYSFNVSHGAAAEFSGFRRRLHEGGSDLNDESQVDYEGNQSESGTSSPHAQRILENSLAEEVSANESEGTTEGEEEEGGDDASQPENAPSQVCGVRASEQTAVSSAEEPTPEESSGSDEWAVI